MDLETLLHRDPISDRGISVVMPVRNVAAHLESAVSEITATLEHLSRGHEIVLVNDGSTDATSEVTEKLMTSNRRIRIVQHAACEGHGAALRSGFSVAKYPLVLQLDCNSEFDSADLSRFLEAIDHLDIVCGFRPSPSRETGRLRTWLYRKILRMVFAVQVRDVDCETRLYRRAALRRIPVQSSGLFANAEILAKATFMNMLIGEVSVGDKARRLAAGVVSRESSGHLLREAAHVFRKPRFCTSSRESDQPEPSSNAA